MQRVNLDSASAAIKKFVASLPIESEGVELELDGRVVCKVVGPHRLTESERDDVMRDGLRLMRKAQQRNKGVSARAVEREVREVVDEVRRRKAQ